MKALLICPAERAEMACLAESTPLVAISVCGKPFLAYWLEHLASLGAREVSILAVDRPERIRSVVGDGARWGVRVEVLPQLRELTPAEARSKFRADSQEKWLDAPHDAIVADHLPSQPGILLFDSLAGFFGAIAQFAPHAATPDRIGVREVSPGVWVGRRSRIDAQARLVAPCWLGENVVVGPHAVVGPNAVVENNVIIESAASIENSHVGPETFIGTLTHINRSIAHGHRLINWQSESFIDVTDSFLLGSLMERKNEWQTPRFLGRAAAALLITVTAPLALLIALRARWQGQRSLHARRAVWPVQGGNWNRTIIYYEFAGAGALWRRWPQLWNIVQGEFEWVGNRPLNPFEAGKLTNDFERLWLAAPIGLVSAGDAEGCFDSATDEARAHASFFAVQSGSLLKLSILRRAFTRLIFSKTADTQAGRNTEKPFPLESTIAQ